jgi:hypothetical protein
VFTEADFKHIDYEEAGVPERHYNEYKKWFLGKPVPPQRESDETLIGSGYGGVGLPEPWVQYLVEEGLMNH